MKPLYPLFGIVTVLNTPFTKKNLIDEQGLRLNVKVALRAGVSGFLVPALASEVNKLSIKERLEMVDIVMDEVGGRVPVIAGTGNNKSLEKSQTIIRSYLDMGCENILFQIPYKDEKIFYEDFKQLATLDPEMIMLQDWDPKGYGLPESLINKLFEEVEAFRCLKIETKLAGPKYSRILELTQGHLNVSGGWAVTQMIEGLTRGVHAFMPTGMHFIYTEIYNEFEKGNFQKAKDLFHRVLPVLSFSNQDIDISIHFFKRLLYKQGIYSTPKVRKPIASFDGIHKEIADNLIKKIIKMEKRIK